MQRSAIIVFMNSTVLRIEIGGLNIENKFGVGGCVLVEELHSAEGSGRLAKKLVDCGYFLFSLLIHLG